MSENYENITKWPLKQHTDVCRNSMETKHFGYRFLSVKITASCLRIWFADIHLWIQQTKHLQCSSTNVGMWDLKEILVSSRLPLHRSYRHASPPCHHSGGAGWEWAYLSCLLVPWLAATVLLALGACQLPTLASSSNAWPTNTVAYSKIQQTKIAVTKI